MNIKVAAFKVSEKSNNILFWTKNAQVNLTVVDALAYAAIGLRFDTRSR